MRRWLSIDLVGRAVLAGAVYAYFAIKVPGFGTVITVLLDRAADMSETFSLILPSVDPPQAIGLPAPLRTFAVTTLHRTGVRPVGEPQSEAYAVMRLTGQALSATVNGA